MKYYEYLNALILDDRRFKRNKCVFSRRFGTIIILKKKKKNDD